jgi:hypothetical protein
MLIGSLSKNVVGLSKAEVMAMQVTVKVAPEAALALQKQQPPTPASRKVAEATRELGIELYPVHPGVKSPLLAPYFIAEVPDRATAEQLISRLHQCEAIEAAYVKPAEAPA